jgi:hypothetical protein
MALGGETEIATEHIGVMEYFWADTDNPAF